MLFRRPLARFSNKAVLSSQQVSFPRWLCSLVNLTQKTVELRGEMRFVAADIGWVNGDRVGVFTHGDAGMSGCPGDERRASGCRISSMMPHSEL